MSTGAAAPASPGSTGSPARGSLAGIAAAAQHGPPDTSFPSAGSGPPAAGSGFPGAIPRPDNLLPRPVRATAVAPAPAPATTKRRKRKANFKPKTKRKRTRVRRGRRKRKPLRTRARLFARRQWRRLIMLTIVAVALTLSLVAAWPVVFSTGNPGEFAPSAAAQEQVATSVLRTVVAGGRSLYDPGSTFAEVTPAMLSAFSSRVPVVGPNTPATPGVVSLRVNNPKMLTLATRADDQRCVFARDEPAQKRTLFVTVRSTDCRAAAAPARGWKSR